MIAKRYQVNIASQMHSYDLGDFCTCPPDFLVRAIHPKAMPVILAASDAEIWLQAPWEEALFLVRQLPDEGKARNRCDPPHLPVVSIANVPYTLL